MRIKKTYLSTRPSARAFWVALWSAMLLALVSLIYWDDVPGLASFLPATRAQIFTRHEYWRLLTTVAVHADFKHLGSNLVLFGILSFILNAYFGLWIFPLLTLLLSSATNFVALLTYSADVTLIGASGAVYVMAGFWLAMYMGIERGHSVANRLIRCVGFTLILLIPEAFEPVVSYRTHAIGFGFGVLAAIPYYFWNRARFRMAEVVVPDEPDDPTDKIESRYHPAETH
ncbi:MAG: rhomboid family intramembrane serine protease [Deltaproteobacteria bacterium]|nr:rhomboid family intramembrane serine protease [Deltaproteobacteria bacterium]